MRFDLFPQQALDSSIITPVLIGLFLIFLFNELFGWVFVGYVVPGYLAAVFFSFPESGIAIVIEAIVTYVLVIGISEGGGRLKLWARFFGRERFLLFVYVSVVVRLVMESVVFARLSLLLPNVLGIQPSNEFFSIGLVLVPLLANAFWKVGLAKGLTQSAFITLLTYLTLAYILVPYTNLNVSKFELTYENLAFDFSSSPKLYIILLTGAFLASTYNLRYGWDYNGIMMPALLAIAFFMPMKVVSTCGEAIIVSSIFAGLVKLPLIKEINFGGGRKIVGLFFVGYVMKWLLASYFPALPTMGVSDLFGFGYLLPSLLGVKILQKRNAFLVLLPTLTAALYAVLLGSGFAAVLYLLPEIYTVSTETRHTRTDLTTNAEPGYLFRDLLTSKAYVLSGGYVESHKPGLNEISWTAEKIAQVIATDEAEGACYIVTFEIPPGSQNPLACFHRTDPELGDYILIHENVEAPTERRGLGVYIVRPGARGPVLQVPRPISEPFSAEAAFLLAEQTDARAVVIAGFDEPLSDALWADVLKTRDTAYHRLYERLRSQEVIQVRTTAGDTNILHARRNLPYALNLSRFRQTFDNLTLDWEMPDDSTLAWRTGMGLSFAVLKLNRQILYRVFPEGKFATAATRIEQPVSVTGLIERWVVEQKDFIQRPASAVFSPPGWRDLELFESEVLRRIFNLTVENDPRVFEVQLRTVQMISQFLGYEIVWFTDVKADTSYLILKESTVQPNTKGWGTAVFRLGAARPWMWTIPRPVSEKGTLGTTARWFELHGGRILFLPGASYRADPYGRADILSRFAPRSLAHTILNEYIRFVGDDAQFLSIVVRGTRSHATRGAILISTGDELISEKQLPAEASTLRQSLLGTGHSVEIFKGEKHQLGLQGLGNPLAGLVRVRRPGHQVTVWVSNLLRTTVFEGARLDDLLASYNRLNISYALGESYDIEPWFEQKALHRGTTATLAPTAMNELLLDYATNMNTAAVRTLANSKGVAVHALADMRATKVYIYAENKDFRCIAVVSGGAVSVRRDEKMSNTNSSLDNCVGLRQKRRAAPAR